MIEILGVSKQFKNETAIDYRDMTFETGKSYMLLGASGCGTSTLLNMIAGILSPTEGEIRIDGVNMCEKSSAEKDRFRIANIGYIFQDFKLIPDMTVMDNINILRLEGINTGEAPRLLHELGILDQKNKKVKHLSGGQKQRVAIARALCKQPAIILADEPTGNLDSKTSQDVLSLLKVTSQKFSQTIVMITHNEEIAQMADRIIRIEDGKIVTRK